MSRGQEQLLWQCPCAWHSIRNMKENGISFLVLLSAGMIISNLSPLTTSISLARQAAVKPRSRAGSGAELPMQNWDITSPHSSSQLHIHPSPTHLKRRTWQQEADGSGKGWWLKFRTNFWLETPTSSSKYSTPGWGLPPCTESHRRSWHGPEGAEPQPCWQGRSQDLFCGSYSIPKP